MASSYMMIILSIMKMHQVVLKLLRRGQTQRKH